MTYNDVVPGDIYGRFYVVKHVDDIVMCVWKVLKSELYNVTFFEIGEFSIVSQKYSVSVVMGAFSVSEI